MDSSWDHEHSHKQIWKMVACAARYGNQQLSEIKDLTYDELNEFCDAIGYWVEAENKSGRQRNNPSGGG